MPSQESYITELIKVQEKYCEFHSQWFYSILIAVSGFLGALIALSDNTWEDLHTRLAFLVAIVSGILCVLLLDVSLLFDSVRYKRLQKEILQAWKNDNKFSPDKSYFGSSSQPKYLLVIGKISYFFLFLMIISTVYYVLAKNLPELFQANLLLPLFF